MPTNTRYNKPHENPLPPRLAIDTGRPEAHLLEGPATFPLAACGVLGAGFLFRRRSAHS